MAYIGIGNRQDYIADFQAQNFSGDGSTTAFTLNYEAVTGSIRVAVDNVLQPADGSSYTVNGFTLNFTAAPASGTNNITVLFLGTVRNVSSVSDGAIVTAKIADGAVTEAKLASGVNTITEADQWRVTANTNTGTNADITTNWERNDNASYGKIGTGLTESSGIFSFPSTGLYAIFGNFTLQVNTDSQAVIQLNVTTDNSTYTNSADGIYGTSGSTGVNGTLSFACYVNVTDITTHKFKFVTSNFATNTFVIGATSKQRTGFTVIRLGDSV